MIGRSSREVSTPRSIVCKYCGWTGKRADLIVVTFEPSILDHLKANLLYAYFQPKDKVQYLCPQCSRVLASDLRYYASFLDEDSFSG